MKAILWGIGVILALASFGCGPTKPVSLPESNPRPLLDPTSPPAALKLPDKAAVLAIPGDTLILDHAVIIDGTGAPPISDGIVVIRQNRILAVGRHHDFAIPVEAAVIDFSSQTVLPGIINTHVHNTYQPTTRYRFLLDGVTSVCDLGSSLRCMPKFDQNYTPDHQPTARGFHSGPMLTAPGGYPGTMYGYAWHYEVADVEQAEAAVNDLISQGVDVIKVALEPGPPQNPWPILSREQVKRIVTTAHAKGLLVRAHVRQAAVLDIALEAGVDVIEHVPLPFCTGAELKRLNDEGKLQLAAFPELKIQLHDMAEQGVVLVPTLDVNISSLQQTPGLTEPEKTQAIDFILESVDYFHRVGGIIALGNDYGSYGVEPGMPLAEMDYLMAAGLSPLEIITSGTGTAAKIIGQDGELGTLAAGKLADLIVVDGDPLSDLTRLKLLILVIKDGQMLFYPSEA